MHLREATDGPDYLKSFGMTFAEFHESYDGISRTLFSKEDRLALLGLASKGEASKQDNVQQLTKWCLNAIGTEVMHGLLEQRCLDTSSRGAALWRKCAQHSLYPCDYAPEAATQAEG